MSYRFADSLLQAVWHTPFLCVQWKTPDDGQRNCPKHVDFYSKIKSEKLAHPVGFIIRMVFTFAGMRTQDRPAPNKVSHATYTLRDLQYSQKTAPVCKSSPAPDYNKANQAVPAVRMRNDWTDHSVTDTCLCSERVLPSLTESNHVSWHTDTRYACTVEFMAYGKGRV